MKKAHTGMNLSDAKLSALAEDTVKALDKLSVPATEKGEVKYRKNALFRPGRVSVAGAKPLLTMNLRNTGFNPYRFGAAPHPAERFGEETG